MNRAARREAKHRNDRLNRHHILATFEQYITRTSFERFWAQVVIAALLTAISETRQSDDPFECCRAILAASTGTEACNLP